MNTSRRDFLKGAIASAILAPLLSKKLWAESIGTDAPKYLGAALRNIHEMTTMHHQVVPELPLLYRTLGLGLPQQLIAGESLRIRNDLLTNSRSLPEANPKTLLFFSQISDTHLVDEESPARTVAAEKYLEIIGVRSAFRPQEDLTLQVLQAALATLKEMTRRSPFDFLLNTGDSIDNAQHNEISWFLNLLQGGEIDPDSGTDQDPVAGPANDANDRFTASGLPTAIPYYSAIGNHDVLLQGNVPPKLRELYNSIAEKLLKFMIIDDPLGDYSNAVITPWSIPPDPEQLPAGYVVADSRRRALNGIDFIGEHLQYPTQRPLLGFPQTLANQEYGYYSIHPKPGLPLVMIVLDTACRLGTSSGVIERSQYEQFLIPELERAQRDQELVMVVSHHPVNDLKTLGNARTEMLERYRHSNEMQTLINEWFERMQPRDRYIERSELLETLQSYPNVFANIAGHNHHHAITPIGEGDHGFWQIQTASLLDYPQQSRLYEIVYEGNGIGAIQTCAVDHNSPEGTLAAHSRQLAYLDSQKNGKSQARLAAGSPADRNTILRFPIPAEIAKKL